MRTILALLLCLCFGPASAQLTTTNVGQGGYGAGLPTGPVDIVASPVACWSLRACSTANLVKLVNVCNSGDANCADINPTAIGDFNVATATGAPLNCGGAGGTCTIKTWYDQSGNAHDATSGTIAVRPTLVFSCLGSKPCAAYSGSQSLVTGAFSSQAQPYSVSVVAIRNAAFTTQAAFFSSNGTGVQFLFANAANQVAIYGGFSIPTVAATDSAWHAFQGLWNVTTSVLNVDGTNNSVSLGASGNNPVSGAACVGSDSGTACAAANPFTGRLTEVILWAGDQSPNFNPLCHNQFAYWGTSVSC